MKPLYKQYGTTPEVGIYTLSNWGGIAILDILYGLDDYVVACFDWGSGREQIRRHKVCHTAGGRSYFWKRGRRWYLDQFLRVGR